MVTLPSSTRYKLSIFFPSSITLISLSVNNSPRFQKYVNSLELENKKELDTLMKSLYTESLTMETI